MSTGQRKTNIFLKKFLSQQDITTHFLDYLHNLILESHEKAVPVAGLYSYPVEARSDAVDTVSFLTDGETLPGDGNGPQLEGDDGHGRILNVEDIRRTNIPVPNVLGTKYFAGFRFNYYPQDTEINVRTGKIKWSLFNEAVGERAEPNVVSYYNNQFTMQVDNVCKGVDQVGRTIRVWLQEPVSQASGDVYEDVAITKQAIAFQHDGGLTFFDVPNEFAGYFQLGQTLTIDKVPTAPVTTTINLVGAVDSGGAGFTRISVADDMTGFTVANNAFILTGNNVVNLIGTLGQGALPSSDPVDYQVFLYGITITEQDLRTDEFYVYLCNYMGTGAGNNPDSFDISDQVKISQDTSNIAKELEEFKVYQLQRNAIILRGGGQFSFNSGVLDWSEDFQLVNPFRGLYHIPTNSISGIINDDVLYSKIYKEQPIIIDGNASGEVWVESTVDFNNGDTVNIGDNDTDKIVGYVNAVGVDGEKLTIVDSGMTPIDLSDFKSSEGGWIQRVSTTLVKGHINEGELRPSVNGKINEDICIIAVCHDDILIFKNGVLRLEDGDTGEISNLPSGFNWVNNNDELENSVTRTGDGNVAVLAPKSYTLSATLEFLKNMSWTGVTEQTDVSGALATPLLKIGFDPDTSDVFQQVEFKNLTLRNSGVGDVIEIDNVGADKGMEIILDSCVLLGNGGKIINVIHSVPTEWIKIKFIDSRKMMNQGSIVFDTRHNDDSLILDNVILSPSDEITFGEASTDPSSTLDINECRLDKIIALGSGNSKIITVQDSYSWANDKKIITENLTQATFKVSQIIIDHRLFTNYQKSRNSMIMKLSKPMTFTSGVLSWINPIEFHDPYYGLAIIDVGSLIGIVEGDVLYTRMFKLQNVKVDGNVGGEIGIEDGTIFADNDLVLIGDEDSVLISGYIMGAPVGDLITVDDGAGSVIDLSGITNSKGGWVRKANLTMVKSQPNIGDLKPDMYGNIDEEIFIIGINRNGEIIYENGQTSQGGVVYEESVLLDADTPIGTVLVLPLDSRQSSIVKYYNVGTADLAIFLNGIRADLMPLTVVNFFDPDTYNAVTGFVNVPDSVNLSLVQPEDKFKDAGGTEFIILGQVDNTPGQKKFNIGPGKTVDLAINAIIIRQAFAEVGSGLSNQIEVKTPIKENARITYRIIPVDQIASGIGGGGGGAGSLQSAYDGGATITIASGNPIVVSGPAGQKLMRFLGDIEVTGVIDPKGMTFSRNTVKPFDETQDGIWCDDTGKFLYYNKDTDESSDIGGGATSGKSYNNPNPSTLSKGSVVTKAGVGNIQYSDHNSDELSRAIGILTDNTPNGESKPVIEFGYVPSGVITSSNFLEDSLPADRSRVWLHASGKMTVTPPVEGSNLYETIIGIWNDSGLNLQVQFLGKA